MKFSVLLPTYNRLEYLAYAIETVRRQDYDDWEVIVSDNCSEEDICGYVSGLGESRVKCVRRSAFVPVTDNWNNALNHSSGDYVIMLGDDDGLLQGYFKSMARLISTYGYPDFIYCAAYVFGYPGTVPGQEKGFLDRTPCPGDGKVEPFWLDRREALSFVADSLNFRMRYPFNMQHSLISRGLIDMLRVKGPFFQSPYPDFYATNAMFLKSERILIDPVPRVVIGITPRSYGFFHFNKEEAEGAAFLNNAPDRVSLDRLKQIIISGSRNYTSWLIAMEALSQRFGSELPVCVGYGRYRFRQILHIYKNRYFDRKIPVDEFHAARSQMCAWEKLVYGIPFALVFFFARIGIPKYIGAKLINRLRPLLGQLVAETGARRAGQFATVLDVFDSVKTSND